MTADGRRVHTRDYPVATLKVVADQLDAWLALPPEQRIPATPRLAATVMVVREKPAGAGIPAAGMPAERASSVEVFMIHRVSTMAFAPDTMVFPGGGVDPRDGDEKVPWRGANDVLWAGRLGSTPEQARMLVCAAVRELFEETGVLLAGPRDSDDLVEPAGPEWAGLRAALVAGELSLAHLLHERDLVLRSDLLRGEAHWITPEFEPRRFDTRIFVARMPVGQHADGLTSEAKSAGWVDPVQVLADVDAGRLNMLPPTRVCLERLVKAANVTEFVDWDPVIEPIMPVLVHVGDGYLLRTTTHHP